MTPGWLRERSVGTDALSKALRRSRPVARVIDRGTGRRLTFLVRGPGTYVIAVVCLGIGAAMPLMELVPFSATGAGAALTVFGLSRVLADLYLLQGSYARALAAADSLAAHGDPRAPLYGGRVHLWRGDLERAHVTFERASAEVLEDALWAMPLIAHLRAARGDSAGARRMLERTEERVGPLPADPFTSTVRLMVTAVRGEVPRAVTALREYAEHGGRDARWIRESPLFAPLRDEPEFQAELAELERIVERQRQQVERDLRSSP